MNASNSDRHPAARNNTDAVVLHSVWRRGALLFPALSGRAVAAHAHVRNAELLSRQRVARCVFVARCVSQAETRHERQQLRPAARCVHGRTEVSSSMSLAWPPQACGLSTECRTRREEHHFSSTEKCKGSYKIFSQISRVTPQRIVATQPQRAGDRCKCSDTGKDRKL